MIAKHGYSYKIPKTIDKEILQARRETKKAYDAYYSIWIDWDGNLYKNLKTAELKEKNLVAKAVKLEKEWKVYNPSNKMIYKVSAKDTTKVPTKLPKKSPQATEFSAQEPEKLPEEKEPQKNIKTHFENINNPHDTISQNQTSISKENENKKNSENNYVDVKKQYPALHQKNTEDADSCTSTYQEDSYISHVKKEPTLPEFKLKQSQRKNQIINEQNAWRESQNLDSIDQNQIAMINAIHAIMIDAKDSITVELGQASLQAWTDAQHAKNFDAYDMYIKKSKKLFTLLQNHHQSSQPHLQKNDRLNYNKLRIY